MYIPYVYHLQVLQNCICMYIYEYMYLLTRGPRSGDAFCFPEGEGKETRFAQGCVGQERG